MIVKSLLAGAMALAFSPVNQASTPPPTFVENAYIEKIQCLEGSGTGFKLKDGRWVSVWHVIRHTDCKVDGLPILVTSHDPQGDFGTFQVVGDNRRGGFEVDCSGFRDRQWYHAQGHAKGLPIIRSIPIMANKLLDWIGADKGWKALIYNQVIPGQSGGPVVDTLSGKAVGTVNAFHPFYPLSYSRQLKDTELCQDTAQA